MKPAIGGGEEIVYETSKELSRRGHQITILTSDLMTPDRKSKRVRGTTRQGNLVIQRYSGLCVHPQYPIVPSLPMKLSRIDCDLIHAHGYGYFTSDTAAIISRIRNKPLVLSLHGFFPATTKANRLLTNFYIAFSKVNLLSTASRVVCQSHEDASIMVKLTDQKKVVTIHNGINAEEWRILPEKGRFRERYGIKSPIILSIGRLVQAKGFHLLLQIVPKLLAQLGEIKVVIAGRDFGYLQHLKKIASDLGISDRVVFTGELSSTALREAYVDATVYTVPSIYEPFGITALEAMASGLAVVGTRNGGLKEFVEEGTNGFVIDPSDEDSYCQALCRVISNDRFRERAGMTNRNKVLTQFTTKQVVDELESLYQEVLREK
jgi:glycosyltransferase involved in cell wall biosynthesis